MLSLARLKTHLRVNHTLEDELLDDYIAAAYERIAAHLNRRIVFEASDQEYATDLVATKMIDLACLKLVGHWYANRELALSATPLQMNELYELIQPYRILYNESETA